MLLDNILCYARIGMFGMFLHQTNVKFVQPLKTNFVIVKTHLLFIRWGGGGSQVFGKRVLRFYAPKGRVGEVGDFSRKRDGYHSFSFLLTLSIVIHVCSADFAISTCLLCVSWRVTNILNSI